MEFIGDRVLGLLIAEWLAERFPREQEGDLGRRLAVLVSQPVLAEVAEEIGLGEALSVAPGEAQAGVRRRATVLADALEAALGALYLDGGLERARAFVRRAWDGAMDRAGDAAEGRQDGAAGMGAGARARAAGLCRCVARRAAACAGVRRDGGGGRVHAAPAQPAASARRNSWRRRSCCGCSARDHRDKPGGRLPLRLRRGRRARRTRASPRWSTG